MKTKKHKNIKNTKTCKNIINEEICDYTKINFKNKHNFSNFFLEIMNSIGVNYCVGLPSSTNIYLYEAINSLKKIKNYLFRNERNGGYISMGASRLTSLNIFKRNLIITYVDLGPGLATLLDAICASTLEQIPSIIVTCQEDSKEEHNRIIQNIDSVKLVENICKSYLLITEEDILNGKIIKKIYDCIIKGFSYPRGSIVFIFEVKTFSMESANYIKNLEKYKKLFNNIFVNDYGFEIKNPIKSKDVFTGLYNENWSKQKNMFSKKNKNKIININQIIPLLKIKLKESKYPIMLIGMGALDYIYELLDFCEKVDIPYILTLPMNSYGNVSNKYYAFRMGHTATYCGNMTIQKCDLLITWGTSLNKYTVVNLNNNFNHIKCIIDVNLNPEIYYTPFINNYIIGDGKDILNILQNNINELVFENKRITWLNMIESYKVEGEKKLSFLYSKTDTEKLKHGDIYKCLQQYVDKFIEKTNKHCFFITDAGSCQPFTASFIHYKSKNYHFITDGKYGSIGCGVGELIGAAINNPNDLFILIAGDSATLDGSVVDYITIKEINLKNIIIIVLENSGIGLISEESQELNTHLLNYKNGYKYFPNWEHLFNSQLMKMYVVRSKREMDKYLNCVFDNLFKNEPSVLLCIVPIESYYYPVIPLGSFFDKMVYKDSDINSKINNCRYKQIQ
jgi:thiamine pyrophosphate-dependent acetolactate synthase large subunit-like protein